MYEPKLIMPLYICIYIDGVDLKKVVDPSLSLSKSSTVMYVSLYYLTDLLPFNVSHNNNKLGTGYDYPDLPGLGNSNEKLGLPERLSTGIQFWFRNPFHGGKIG